MRLAMVATPAALPDLRPAPGSLDGDMIRARLALQDASFQVVDLDPAVDVAEQIEGLFDRGEAGDEPVLLYASCTVILDVEGEIFLSFDPSQPETGDALQDIALVFRERARGPVAFFLELRHAPDPEDPFRSATVVAAAKQAMAAGGAIDVLVAARPLAPDEQDDRASPLTRALIEALDDPDAQYGLTLAAFVAAARDNPEIAGAVPCFAYVRTPSQFALLPVVPRPASRPPRDPSLPSIEPEAEAPPARRVSAPILPGPIAGEAPPARGSLVSIPVVIDDAPAPPEPRPPMRSIEVDLDEGDRAPLIPEPEPEPAPEPPPPTKPSPSASPPSAKPSAPPPAPAPASIPPSRTSPQSSARAAAAVLPEQRTFLKSEPPPPRVILSEPPPPTSREPPARSSEPPASKRPGAAPPAKVDHPRPITSPLGDALKGAGDFEAALASYKRALACSAPRATAERAEIVRAARADEAGAGEAARGDRELREGARPLPDLRGAGARPGRPARDAGGAPRAERRRGRPPRHRRRRGAAPRRDHRPEGALLRLLAFGARWQDDVDDPFRARNALERARALEPDDVAVLERLAALYQGGGMIAEALMTRQRLAALTRDPRERAERYFALGQHCLTELRREELALDLFDLALESDPTLLEPLAVIARVLADRQEWSQLERAYRRMLERVDHIPKGSVRTEVTFELCRRLGLLFRDHLEDPALGLDAFEDAVHAKPKDLAMVLETADLARSLGKHDKVALYLETAAALDPTRAETYHDLFEAFQKVRRPDQAYQAACVTMLLRQADARERFIFEEHKPEGLPKPAYALPPEGWEWLRPRENDVHAGAVLAAITPSAIAVRLAQLAAEGRLPEPDPALRQDPTTSTISVVRSFAWASHILSVPAPAIFLNDDRDFSLAAVVAEEPTVIAGGKAQRGRSPTELAFLVGRHLAYHIGAHRLLLYYPSIEELTNCFLAAIRIVLPEVPAPPAMRATVTELERGIALRLGEAARVDLAAAVAAFEANGSRVHLAEWAADVERSATRAGFLVCGDLEVAAGVLRSEPRVLLEPEEKVQDLCAFAISDEHHALREALGVAVQP